MDIEIGTFYLGLDVGVFYVAAAVLLVFFGRR